MKINEQKDFPFELKAEEMTESGIFSGYASMFGGEPDTYGDIVMQGAYVDTLEKGGRNGTGIAMLWQHDITKPIGVWKKIEENKKGLQVEGQLALSTQAGKEAYELMKIGAIKGLSIGYQVNKDGYEIDDRRKIRKLKTIELWEISPVTFPASVRSQITGVKEAIINAKTERQLEEALREAGLSRSVARYISSSMKKDLSEKWKDYSVMNLLRNLREANREIINW